MSKHIKLRAEYCGKINKIKLKIINMTHFGLEFGDPALLERAYRFKAKTGLSLRSYGPTFDLKYLHFHAWPIIYLPNRPEGLIASSEGLIEVKDYAMIKQSVVEYNEFFK